MVVAATVAAMVVGVSTAVQAVGREAQTLPRHRQTLCTERRDRAALDGRGAFCAWKKGGDELPHMGGELFAPARS